MAARKLARLNKDKTYCKHQMTTNCPFIVTRRVTETIQCKSSNNDDYSTVRARSISLGRKNGRHHRKPKLRNLDALAAPLETGGRYTRMAKHGWGGMTHVFSGRWADAPRCPQHSISLGCRIVRGAGWPLLIDVMMSCKRFRCSSGD